MNTKEATVKVVDLSMELSKSDRLIFFQNMAALSIAYLRGKMDRD